MPAERTDIQGIVRSGYGTLSEALFVLLRISDAVAAKRWLAAAPVTSAAFEGKLTGALQVALTPRGLRALGLSDEAVALFSPEFTSGMAGDAGRSRRLGDEDVNDPRHWAWGGAADETGLLLMLYAEPGGLAAWRDMVETEHYRQGFEVLRELPTSDLGGHEPFGFADGISQPKLNWDAPIRRLGDDVAEYTNRMELGEVLLGYGNEYGLVTDRPLLEATADPTAILAAADGRADIACNGSYLVLRQLEQDVAGFWRFADAHGGQAFAEAMVGRTMSGAPLLATGRQIDGVEQGDSANQFSFGDDPDGQLCPVGAHVRRANPRTGDRPSQRHGIGSLLQLLGLTDEGAAGDTVAASRFHRILRRGRSYGSYHGGPATAATGPSGLYFICLNANIARQFEFIQGAWLQSSKFGGLNGERDPLVATRMPLQDGSATDSFTRPRDGAATRVDGLPAFVTMRGGAYFFLPGLRALRYLASL